MSNNLVNFQLTITENDLRRFGINLGREENEIIGEEIDNFFKDNKEELLEVLGQAVLTAISQLNMLYRGIPVYTGRYIASLLGGWLVGVNMSDILTKIVPHGVTASKNKRKEIDWNIFNDWRSMSDSITNIRKINTGGGLNPYMAIIYSFRLNTGSHKPDYWTKIEETGWVRTSAYDITSSLRFILQFSGNRIQKKIEELIGEKW